MRKNKNDQLNDRRLTLTIKDLCHELNISKPVALKLVKNKEFPACRVGRKYLIPRHELIKWLSEQTGTSNIIKKEEV